MHGLTGLVAQTVFKHYFAVLSILLLAWLARNRYYHGLNKYPGPVMASLTDWWRFMDVWRRRPEVTQMKLHEQYGDVVRLGPNTLSFADPGVLKRIYGLNKGFVKSDFYVVQQSVVKGRSLPSLFSTVDNDFHQQFRRCVNAAFSMSALVQYEPFVDNTTKLFLDRTHELFVGNPQGCDLTRWLQFYAFDVIGEITYSKRHGFLEKNEDIDGIIAYLSGLFNYVAPIGQIPILDKLFLKNPLYLTLSSWGLLDATFPVAKFARARMAERLPTSTFSSSSSSTSPTSTITANLQTTSLSTSAEKANPPPTLDLLAKFLSARDTHPDFMSDTLVQTMAVSMAFAGSETTAISLASVIYHLLRNPAAYRRLRAEIDDAALNGNDQGGLFSDYETGLVTWRESQQLVYLDAVIKEAFRMHPAAGLPLERVVPPQGVEMPPSTTTKAGPSAKEKKREKLFIPGGTIIGCSAWVIHRNKQVFGEDADVFRPERWLINDRHETAEDTKKEEARIREMTGTMLHFGMGSRTCIGKNISLMEIYKLVPSLLRRFDIEFQDPEKDWKICNSWFVKQSDFWVRFTPRKILKPQSQAKAGL
ncbi:cytochrome P450 [Coniella lustricola]|uniref:Cytochrome P450 n=1 Tax=Coniella lustricola TaxID=2025994 RepID=A0A2T3ALY5_9PEZI|nr:cytochrome P450 [Coniella lustricola]